MVKIFNKNVKSPGNKSERKQPYIKYEKIMGFFLMWKVCKKYRMCFWNIGCVFDKKKE